MAKKVSAKEHQDLYALMFESCLFSAHGVVVSGVKEGVSNLLRTLKRDDLAALWEDHDKLLAVPAVVSVK